MANSKIDFNEAIADFYGDHYREIEQIIELSCDPFLDFSRLLKAIPSCLNDNPEDDDEMRELRAEAREWLERYSAWRKAREAKDAEASE